VTCLDDAIVLGLIEGRLAPPILADVDDHLDDCPTCRDVVAQVARVQAPVHVLERGHTLGRYVIGDLLGSGAMGRVYSAWEPELDRRVALKVLVTDGDGARERIVREAQAMAKLDHANVVGVHEVGTADDGVFVAMELVDGQTLRVWAAVPHDWREIVAVLIGITRGLAAVHAAGVVHRDIKPDNIIVGTDGRARLGDFGLARSGVTTGIALSPGAGIAVGTPVTAIAGTPAYMAPEVLRGAGATTASDQFSFGVTAYEVLAGTRPFSGGSWAELLTTIEAGRPPTIRGIPGWLDDIVQRCLVAEPGRRFSSMTALAAELEQRASKRSPARWFGGVLAAAAIASGVTWFMARGESRAIASCDAGSAELAEVWNPKARAQLSTIGALALAALDRWAERWSAERNATCAAARTEQVARVVARDRCLDQRRSELGALIAQLSSLSPALSPADRLTDALLVLPSPAECAIAEVGAADPLPIDPVRAAIVREVEAGLPAIRAANALGDSRPVIATAGTLVERARASGHPPTLAEALLVQSETLRGSSQLAEAQTTARDALAAAERGHSDLLAARAWIARVATAGDLRELSIAEDFGQIAAAAVDRAGTPPRLAATLLRLRGLIAYNRGLLDDARILLTSAHARFVEIAGARSLEVATVESALGSVARAASDLDTAERWHRSALSIDRELRAASHPDLARDLHNIAGVLRLHGDLDGAAATYREALGIEQASRGPHSVEAALTHNSLGLVHMARGDWSAARTELTLARDLLTAADHGDRAFAEHNLGIVEAAVGDHALALTHFARAAEIYAVTIGPGAEAAQRLVGDQASSRHALRTHTAPATLPVPVIVRTELPVRPDVAVRPALAAEPAAAAPPPAPANPTKPRDVGVYGSTQSW
jgi:hypothetical protein